MRVGSPRFGVRFFGDLNLGRRQARAPVSNWAFLLCSPPVPDSVDFPMVSPIASGFVDLAYVARFFADFATGNADLPWRFDADFAMVTFPIGGRINFIARI